MRRACQAWTSSSGAAASVTGGSSATDSDLIPVIRRTLAAVRRRPARNTFDSLRVTIQTNTCGIDHHGDGETSSVMAQYRTTSSRLLGLEPELGDGLLAHHKLLDLAGDGHREFGHEFDVARNLVVGDLALAEFADLLGRGGFAALQLDPGA